MESIKDEQFSTPLGEKQEEYETLHVNIDVNHDYCPVTVCFQLSPEELEELNKNGGKIYYQQCLFRVALEDPETHEMHYAPREKFHPMNIQLINPLNS